MINLNLQTQKEKQVTIICTIVKIVTVILIVLATVFIAFIIKSEFESAEKYMEQSVLQTASNMRGRLTNSVNETKVLALKLANYTSSFSEQEINNFLAAHINDYDYKKLVFVYPNGKAIRWQKGTGKLPDENWKNDGRIKAATSNSGHFSTLKPDAATPSGYVNEFGVPVYSNHQFMGIICAQVYATPYIKILNWNNYNEKGASYIVDRNGRIVVRTKKIGLENENFFDSSRINTIGINRESLREDVGQKESGSFVFRMNHKTYIASYARIDNIDRYVLTVVPAEVLMLQIDKILWGIFGIILLAGGLMLLLSHYSNKLFEENEKTIYQIAFIDETTGEENKNKFKIDVTNTLKKDADGNYAVISICLDKFKAAKQLYGTEKINSILKDILNIIKSNLTPGSICAKDDRENTFIVLYKYEKEDFISKYFVEKIIDDLNVYNEQSILLVSSEGMVIVELALSFGIYPISDKTETIDQMCEKAYFARSGIKSTLVNAYKYYDESMMAQILQDRAIEAEMHYALNDNQFKMYLQPKFDLKTKTLTGAEALARWIHPQKGTVPPVQFVPLFEKNGFVVELDKAIWQQACEFLFDRKRQGLPLFPISVNVSRLHLNNSNFINTLKELVKRYDIEPRYLILEVTESACFENERLFKSAIDELKAFGFMIAMDDFGTGYSSLNMIRELPIDILKLDRRFIENTTTNSRGQIVIKCIVDMANKLNMITVAEGVETAEQAMFLEQIGCRIAQGFLYGRPVDVYTFVNDFLS